MADGSWQLAVGSWQLESRCEYVWEDEKYKLKIAFVIINANRFEGTSRAVLEVAERMANDHEVDLWARTVEDADLKRLKHIAIPGPARPEIADFASFKWQVNIALNAAKYDIVHSAGPNTSKANVYTIQTVHPVKVQQTAASRTTMKAGLIRRLSWSFYDWYVVRAERQAYRAKTSRGPRAFLPVSEGTRKELLDTYPNCANKSNGNNIHIVPNGADLVRFQPNNRSLYRDAVRSEYQIAPDDFLLLFSGGDWRRKGLDLALHALAEIADPRVKLLIVGNDRAGQDVRDLCTELGLDERVRFAGFQREVHHYYAAGDLFVFPTVYEAFSLATIEAAASGLPVLMPDVSGAKELIGSGETGSFILREPEHIAQTILKYYHSPELLHRSGVAARALVEREFSWDTIAARTLEVYEGLLAMGKKE